MSGKLPEVAKHSVIVVVVVFFVFMTLLFVVFDEDWDDIVQMWLLMAVVSLMFIVPAYVGFKLSKGSYERGGWIFILGFFVMAAVIAFFIEYIV